MKNRLLILIFSLSFLVIAQPSSITPDSSFAQVDCSGTSPVFRSDGLVSSTDIVGIFNTELGKCVVDRNASLKKSLIPSYEELKANHFDKLQTGPKIKKKTLDEGDIIVQKTGPKKIKVKGGSDDNVYHIKNGNLMIFDNIEIDDIGVIFVDKDLYIYPEDGKLDHTTNTGGLVFIVKGNVNIEKNITRVDAIIIAEGKICTAWDANTNTCPNNLITEQLVINGSIIDINKVDTQPIRFNRKLVDNNLPSEKVVTAPKYLAILKDLLSQTSQNWTEVAGPLISFSIPTPGPSVPPGPTPVPSSAPTPAPSIPTPPAAYRRIFVTKGAYSGDFSGQTKGIAGADSICQTAANTAGLGGSWKAWISDKTTDASSRLEKATVPYRLVDGTTTIANDWADLTDGSLQHQIDMDEYKNTLNEPVWTATNQLGSKNSDSNCDNWKAIEMCDEDSCSAFNGGVGNSKEKGAGWTNWSTHQCKTKNHLYCVEQKTGPPLKVFVTKETFNGKLNGVVGADAICQDTAQSQGLGTSWKAWITEDSPNAAPAVRFKHNDNSYTLLNGEYIAFTWNDLLDGTLNRPININEEGKFQDGDVWTGTTAKGGGAQIDDSYEMCNKWSDSSNNWRAVIGRTTSKNESWTSYFSPPLVTCNNRHHLYCFQQPAGTIPPPKRVFITSQKYSGNLGGVAGANAKCQTAADNEKLGGTWKAWISDSKLPPSFTFNRSNGVYRRLDKVIIAANWDNLTSGKLLAPINVNEKGETVAPGIDSDGNPIPVTVWSNTNQFGNIAGFTTNNHCNNWTTAGAYTANVGFGTIYSTLGWTHAATRYCNAASGHLYCFEQ